jgi:hypothetical protein
VRRRLQFATVPCGSVSIIATRCLSPTGDCKTDGECALAAATLLSSQYDCVHSASLFNRVAQWRWQRFRFESRRPDWYYSNYGRRNQGTGQPTFIASSINTRSTDLCAFSFEAFAKRSKHGFSQRLPNTSRSRLKPRRMRRQLTAKTAPDRTKFTRYKPYCSKPLLFDEPETKYGLRLSS